MLTIQEEGDKKLAYVLENLEEKFEKIIVALNKVYFLQFNDCIKVYAIVGYYHPRQMDLF